MLKCPMNTFLALAVLTTTTVAIPIAANADSCWDHNGSVMRLKAQGDQRWFYYEQPKSVMRRAGVTKGTLLFDGWKQGDWYSGTMRRFSKYCPGAPMEYHVEGPVASSQRKVTVHGDYEVNRRCQPTGQYKPDTLVFTYLYDC